VFATSVGAVAASDDEDDHDCSPVLLAAHAHAHLLPLTETSNLDGETNLKIKQAVPETYEIECDPEGLDFPEQFAGMRSSCGY